MQNTTPTEARPATQGEKVELKEVVAPATVRFPDGFTARFCSLKKRGQFEVIGCFSDTGDYDHFNACMMVEVIS